MTTTLLAEAKDLAILLNLPANDPGLELALRRATDAFIGAVGHPVVRTEATRLLRGDGGPELQIPARPVHSATVTLGDRSHTALPGATTGSVILDGHLGTLTRPSTWPRGAMVSVTYDAGYGPDEIPGDIQDVVLERAAHIAEDLGVFRQESVGSVSVTVEAAAAGGATQRWVDTVDRYRVGVREWS